MDQVLKALLDQLDAIAETNAEILDADAREILSRALFNAYIDPVDAYELPDDFGLFSEEGNQKVRSAIKHFIDAAIPIAIENKLYLPEDKLIEFQNEDVVSENGTVYDDYFGYTEVC